MLKVELRSRENREAGQSQNYLVINDREIYRSWGGRYGEIGITGGIYDDDAVSLIEGHRFVDLWPHFDAVHLPYQPDWLDDLYGLEIVLRDQGNPRPYLKLKLTVELEEWARPWSLADFATQLEETITTMAIPGLTYYQDDEEFITNGFGFRCEIGDLNSEVSAEISRWDTLIRPVIDEALANVYSHSAKNTLVTLFNFPQEIASACEQYLIYFAQFLADLGIDADVSLNHDAHRVLFGVSPKDSTNALETIRAALDVYLRLPNDPAFRSDMASATDIAVLQLQANISHLEGQVRLGYAVLQAKDATIQALQLSNFRLQQTVDANLQPNSSQILSSTSERKKRDSESLVDGIMSVQDIEIKGVVLHMPEIIRRLKRRFSRKRGGA